MGRALLLFALAGTGLVLFPGCSSRGLALRSARDLLAATDRSFASDEDPELVREAMPFGLKTIESLLGESPRDRALLLAAASGFTRYAFSFLQQDADFAEERDLAQATALRERAVGLYLRGRDYGLRGLELDRPGLREQARADPAASLRGLGKGDVPFLYWTAAAWAGAMALRKSDSSLTADQGLVEAMMRQALELDEAFGSGVIHEFFISYEGDRSALGGSPARAREHFQRSLALSRGARAWPYLRLAEGASVASQDRREFERLLKEALALDAGLVPAERLSNLVAQRRARWLLSRTDELFVE